MPLQFAAQIGGFDVKGVFNILIYTNGLWYCSRTVHYEEFCFNSFVFIKGFLYWPGCFEYIILRIQNKSLIFLNFSFFLKAKGPHFFCFYFTSWL